HSPNFTSVPEDVRAIKKEALISKLSSPEGLSGLGERKKRSFCRATSPLPEDVREIKKDELISKFCIGEELLHLGRQPEKGYVRSRSPSPLPDDIRRLKKDELISKFSTAEGLAHLGEQKNQGYARSRSPSPLPDDVRRLKKDELISKFSTAEGLAHLGEQKNQVPILNPHCVSPLPEDVRDHKKDELISSLTSTQGLVAEREDWSEEIESMVRFGEYSPQNPGLLSPGKTLLGLGEYEEKRRQILERKKREYLEQMAHVRQTVKDVKHQPEYYEYATKSSLNNVGCQTDLKITGYTDDENGLSPVAVATQTPGGEVPIASSSSPYSYNTNMSTQTSGGNIRYPKIVPATTVNYPGSGPVPQPYFPLSPRERKMAEFRESYSPSFLQGLPMRQGVFEMSSEPDMRKRREAYQEELRKQIEEKRRIEAEEQEKERRKEAAITRRAELQRERMKQEYIEEETRRKEKQLQRMQQADEFQRKQEAMKLQAELEREAEARRKLEKRLEELEAGLDHHTPNITQALGVSLPVPALRSKLAKEAAFHENQKVTEDIKLVEDIVSRNNQESIVINDNLADDVEHDSENHKDKTQYYPQFSESEYISRHTEYNFNKHSPLRDSNEPAIYSYHRPPTDIIRAAGYSENVPSLYDENKNSQSRHSSTASENAHQNVNVQHESSGHKNTLENALSIPILRAPSPVIPTARLSNATAGSEAMRKLEGKWQVR
ncbi:hypothetical protein C0J52_21488, partial [Blattella germanica]